MPVKPNTHEVLSNLRVISLADGVLRDGGETVEKGILGPIAGIVALHESAIESSVENLNLETIDRKTSGGLAYAVQILTGSAGKTNAMLVVKREINENFWDMMCLPINAVRRS